MSADGSYARSVVETLLSVGPLAHLHRGDAAAPAINDYDGISPAFDDVMGYDFHDATHGLRRAVAADLAQDGRLRCLDLCAGTGLYLSRLGAEFEVEAWGIDRSSGQIGIARERARSDRGAFSYTVADVRETALPQGVDLASINFDALNHLPDADAWADTFRRAHAALRPGGAFILDVNLPERLLHDWDSPEVIVKDTVTYIQLAHPAFQRGRGVVRQTPMIIFQRVPHGEFRRLDATIEQFALPLAETMELLKACGFARISVLQEPTAHPVGHLFNKNRAFLRADK